MGLLERLGLRSAARPGSGEAPGRNDPCWCGSGRKYKRCHLDRDRLREQGKRRSCVSS